MKKVILFVIFTISLVFSLCAWSSNKPIIYRDFVWTMPSIANDDPFYFRPEGNAYMSSGIQVSIDDLSNLQLECIEAMNTKIWDNYYPFYGHTVDTFKFEIVIFGNYSPSRYVLRCTNTTSSSVYYFCDESGNLIYSVSATSDNLFLKPLYDLINVIKNTLSNIFGSVDLIESYVDGIESALDSLSGKLSYNNQSIAYYAYYINSRIQNVFTRLGTVDSHIQSIMDYVDGVEGLLTDIYGRQQDTIDAIYEVSQDIIDNAKDLVLISNDYLDSNSDPIERRTIPYESATDICAYMNEHFYGKKINVVDADTATVVSRYFIHCYLSDSGLICVKYSAFLDRGSVYTGYLCDPRIVLLQAKSPTYGQYFTAVINNVDVSLMGLLASVDANVAYLHADIVGMASVLNTINNALTIDGIRIDNSSSNPIHTYSVPDTLYSTGFTTNGNDVPYPLIHIAWDAACNLIADLNSDSIGDNINHISRGGGSTSDRSVVSAYIDDNNYLRVTTQSGSLTPTVSYLCDPQQSLYIADPAPHSVDHWLDFVTIMSQIDGRLARLEGYTDGLESLIGTTNSSLSSIQGINSAILSHLDSADLVNDSFISDLVEDWGDHFVYTVLNSDNVLSLFNSAFGDLPSDLDWDGARGFFEAFYRGDE